jgi:signal transduction histidine kinase
MGPANAFWALCILASALATWTPYQLRVRQVARSLNARFDERLAERTRVAREIHDTLLQTVQGTKMVADNALSRPDDSDGMRHTMEQVSTWLGQASAEGRTAISALRASTTETNDLAEALRRAIEDCRRQAPIDATLSVLGNAREMHPVVRDEIYRMAYEAIRNACTHSGGSRLNVDLTYGQDLVVRVIDDGIGLDPSIADTGKHGHFGLAGMRERAARIGAKLTIASAANTGTEVVIAVPARVIFRKG